MDAGKVSGKTPVWVGTGNGAAPALGERAPASPLGPDVGEGGVAPGAASLLVTLRSV
jgi:hypothetical protein